MEREARLIAGLAGLGRMPMTSARCLGGTLRSQGLRGELCPPVATPARVWTGLTCYVPLSDSPWKVHLPNVGPEKTGVTVRGLTPARTYQFRVCAVNQVGKGQYSAETSRCVEARAVVCMPRCGAGGRGQGADSSLASAAGHRPRPSVTAHRHGRGAVPEETQPGRPGIPDCSGDESWASVALWPCWPELCLTAQPSAYLQGRAFQVQCPSPTLPASQWERGPPPGQVNTGQGVVRGVG